MSNLNHGRFPLDMYRCKFFSTPQRILMAAMDFHPRAVNYNNLVTLTGAKYGTIKTAVHRLAKEGKVVKTKDGGFEAVKMPPLAECCERFSPEHLRNLTGIYGENGLRRKGFPNPLLEVQEKAAARALVAMETGSLPYCFSRTDLEWMHSRGCLPPTEVSWWTQTLPSLVGSNPQPGPLRAFAKEVHGYAVAMGRASAEQDDRTLTMALAGHLLAAARRIDAKKALNKPIGMMQNLVESIPSPKRPGVEHDKTLWAHSLVQPDQLWMEEFLQSLTTTT